MICPYQESGGLCEDCPNKEDCGNWKESAYDNKGFFDKWNDEYDY